jgi:peptidoglycan/LPS O-acetylase OafA/YrhL
VKTVRVLGDFPARANNFTAVRLVAALLVLYGHSFALNPPSGREDLSHSLNLPGSHVVGLYVFFLISGYLVTQSLANHSLGFFIKSRLLRIVPGLAFSVIVTVAACAVIGRRDLSVLGSPARWQFVLTNVTLLDADSGTRLGLFAANRVPQHVNGSLWTIPLETTCYAILAATAAFGLFRSTRVRIAGSAAVLVALSMMPAFEMLPGTLRHTCVYFFAAGWLIYAFRDYFPISPWIAATFAFALVCAPIAPGNLKLPIQYAAIVYAVFYGAFAHRAPEPVGDYSYGTYLFGFPVQQTIAATMPDLGPIAAFGVSILAVAPLAVFSWHFVENPALAKKQSESRLLTGLLVGFGLLAFTQSRLAPLPVIVASAGFAIALRRAIGRPSSEPAVADLSA